MVYQFGLFEFAADAGALCKQGRAVRLEPQPARALALLLSRAGALVSRDEMRGYLWEEGVHVDFDRGLAYCIGQVRTALGDTAENPRFVETVPRRGYRFIAPVRCLDPVSPPEATVAPAPRLAATNALPARPSPFEPSGHDAPPNRPPTAWWPLVPMILAVAVAVGWAGWSAWHPTRPVVAVAMFDNETGRQDYDGLAMTAADVVVDRLTALGPEALGVVGNTPLLRQSRAARDPAAIRAETGAGYLVLGQVQPDDAGVRLVVHLIRLDDNTHLWVTRVPRPEDGTAGLQEVAAERLAAAVRAHVIARDPRAPRFTR